ncbi:MAG: dihydropteroate synthase [Nitriliruptoraceae bacterium]
MADSDPSISGPIARAGADVDAPATTPEPLALPDVWTPAGVLPTSRRTVVMAVLNVTPDSFSDGGTHFRPGDATPAVEAGLALVEQGADVVDVGGESTRPGAVPVDADEELRRVLPVVRGLTDAGVMVSIDTAKAVVARAAVEAGAALVNDVSAGSLDRDLLPTVADLDVAYVLMHMQGTPRTMQVDPHYDDVVTDVRDHLAGHLTRLEALGIARERVIVDPGIGFGKTVAHNLELLRRLRELTTLGRPVLVGASRKSFLGHLTGQSDPSRRTAASVAAATLAVANGASIVRVHDVHETCDAVAVADAVRRPATLDGSPRSGANRE